MSVTKAQVVNGVAPALDVLWSIHLNVQDHKCFYADKIEIAINHLLRLMKESQNEAEN